MRSFALFDRKIVISLAAGVALASAGCGDNGDVNAGQGSDGPMGAQVNQFPHDDGNATSGRDLFRLETFGDENFWTDVVKLPQGIMAAGLTPKQALAAGYNVNIDALPASTQAAIAAELHTDLSPANAPMLNSAATTIALINANAIIGVVARDSNHDGTIDITAGDKSA